MLFRGGPPKPAYTGPRLKYFLWKKTPRGGLWDGKPDPVAKHFVKEKLLCEVFEVKEDAEKKAKDKAAKEAAAASEAEKSKKVKGFTVTGQRLQNVGISLKKLKRTVEDVARALWTCDDSELDEDALEAVLKLFPQPEEIMGLKNERKIENIDWSEAERFMFLLAVSVPDTKDRVALWRASKEYGAAVEAAEASVSTLEKVAALLSSKTSRLSTALRIILAMGNIMNRGSSHADAPGFRLENLQMLTLVKGVDGKTTLMEVLIRTILSGEAQIEERRRSGVAGIGSTPLEKSLTEAISSSNNKDNPTLDGGANNAQPSSSSTVTSAAPSPTKRANSSETIGNDSLTPAMVDQLFKKGSLLQWPEDLVQPLLEAGKCPLQGVSTQVTQLQHSLQKMRKIATDHSQSTATANAKNAKTSGIPTDLDARHVLAVDPSLPRESVTADTPILADALPSIVSQCAAQFTQRVSDLSLRHQSLKEDLSSMIEFFGEDPNNCDEVTIFGHILAFARSFEEWTEKIQKQDRIAEKELKARLEKEKQQQSLQSPLSTNGDPSFSSASPPPASLTSVGGSSEIARTASGFGLPPHRRRRMIGDDTTSSDDDK